MNVKRGAVSGVIIERRRQLKVNVIGKSKSRIYLPRQHESIRCGNFLACLTTGSVRRKRWVRPYRILRILIVINELRKVCENVELQFGRFTLGYNSLAAFATLFAIRLDCTASAAKVEGKRVLPLLRETFRIDIVIPYHRGRYERLWHSAAGKLEVRETRVTEICLAHEDAILVFCERTARGFASESDVC